MKTKKNILRLYALLILLFLSSYFIAKSVSDSKHKPTIKKDSIPKDTHDNDISEGGEIFENKCNQCHLLSRPLSKNKNLTGWRKTTKRMAQKTKNRIKGKITKEEAEKIAKYLYFLNNRENNLK